MRFTMFRFPSSQPHPVLTLDQYMRRRRLMRWIGTPCVVVLLAAVSWADHRGSLLYPGDDLGRFEDHWFEVREVVSADTLVVAASPPVRVRLCGLALPERTVAEAQGSITQICLGRRVRLRFDRRRVRNSSGELIAYVEMADGSLLNERLLAAGHCRADPGLVHERLPLFELLEAQARYDGVGAWAARH